MHRYAVSLYLETALHVSGGTSTHHQERIQLYLQHLVFVTPLLLSAAIVEELEPVWVDGRSGLWHQKAAKCSYLFQNAQTGSWTRPACHSMGSKVPSPAIKRQARETDFQPVPWLWISGALPLLPIYTFMVWQEHYYFLQLHTAAFKAYCVIWVRRSNFRHQASPRVSPRESNQRRKVELWVRNVR